MKHLEELKIGVTAVLFCTVMFVVCTVFPKDGFVPATKAPMPKIPSADSWTEEEDYGFQIYTQESNYEDSYNEDNSYEDNSSYTSPQEEPDTVPTEPDLGDQPSQEADPNVSPDDTSSQEQPVPEETYPNDSYVEEPVDDSYDDDSLDSGTDDFDWNETEQTFYE